MNREMVRAVGFGGFALIAWLGAARQTPAQDGKITCMTPTRARLLRKRRQFMGITTSAPRRRSRRPCGLSLLL